MIRTLFSRLGIDISIFYTLLTRILQGGGGLLIIFFITLYLNKIEQGYFYTFGSIVAIQVFFELGLNTIITQFAAHEFGGLEITDNKINGQLDNKSRISSLFKFCLKVFPYLAFALFFILIIVGFIFFSTYNNIGINWKLPWIILSLSTSILFLTSPFLALLEGIGFIKEISRARFFQQIIYILVISLAFISNFGLLSISLASLTSCLYLIYYILSTHRDILLHMFKFKTYKIISYRNEIFPFQWKIAISWISGYFIFQIFNPVVFAKEGATVAGQMGLTLTALSGISSLSMSWISTKIQTFSTLISNSDYKNLDMIFCRSLRQAVIINLILLITFLSFIFFLKINFNHISSRFLPLFPLSLLAIVTLANQFIFSWSTYIRCHKIEPFLLNSLVGAFLNITSIYFIGNKFGLMGIIYGYVFITTFIGIPWTYIIYIKKKKKWHL